MEKKLYYELTDDYEMNVTADLKPCMEIIESHMSEYDNMLNQNIFHLEPKWLTDQEYEDLGESDNY